TTVNLSGNTITGNNSGGQIVNVPTVNFTGTTGTVRDDITINGNSLQHTRDPLGTNVVNQALTLTNVTNLNLYGGGDDDAFNVPAVPVPVLVVDGGTGSDTLTGPNVASTWNITGTNTGNIPGAVSSFSSVENLTGGSANDTFVFTANGVGVAGVIDGGGGTNALDYSAFTTAVAANLRLRTAGLSGTLHAHPEVGPTPSPTPRP